MFHFLSSGMCVNDEVQLRVAREPGTQENSFLYHIEDGWYYHLNNGKRAGVMYFKCIYYERGCRGRAICRAGAGFTHSSPHNHDPDEHYAEEMELRRCVLERCRSLDLVTFRNIIDEEGRRFNDEVRSRVTLPRMRSSMRQARMSVLPPIPVTLQGLSIILMDQRFALLTMTVDGTDNLFAGAVTDNDGCHHVMFCSGRMLQFARTVPQLHCDGTFQVVPAHPEGIQQVLTIIASWRHHVLPLGWILMERRTETAYTAVLQLLAQKLGPDINLRVVMTDFERALQNAWERVFNVDMVGCLWHLCRAFILKASKLGLIVWMRRSRFIRDMIRRTCALPLLPRNLMRRGLVLLMRLSRRHRRNVFRLLAPFFRYIWNRWVNHRHRRRWMCVHGSIHRTNNVCESHNRRLRDILGPHPNLYRCIAGFAAIEDTTHRDMITLRQGYPASRRRKASAVANDARIRRLTDDLENPPDNIDLAILRFLRGAALTLENVVYEAMEQFN